MIAACDTFRSGAVEQLKTHCARLGVPLYERGYEKDPAKVAFEAQRAAARASTDVLLVDTAGAPPAQGFSLGPCTPAAAVRAPSRSLAMAAGGAAPAQAACAPAWPRLCLSVCGEGSRGAAAPAGDVCAAAAPPGADARVHAGKLVFKLAARLRRNGALCRGGRQAACRTTSR